MLAVVGGFGYGVKWVGDMGHGQGMVGEGGNSGEEIVVKGTGVTKEGEIHTPLITSSMRDIRFVNLTWDRGVLEETG